MVIGATLASNTTKLSNKLYLQISTNT